MPPKPTDAKRNTAKKAFGARFTRALVHASYNHAELARELDLTPGAVGHWANGRRIPPTETISLVAGILGVREAWLAFGDGEMLVEAPRPARVKAAPKRTRKAA